jgi:hypothetical protein
MTHGEPGATVLSLMLLLGAWHGLNPGMGWLFAVALGMQEKKGSAVAASLLPIALGHALAVGVVVLAAVFLGAALPIQIIRYVLAAVLVGLGVLFIMRNHFHPRWVRMRVGFADLTVWSFLMASAHGAGLMVVPVLLAGTTVEASGTMPAHHHMTAAGPLAGLLATGVHTMAYLAVTGLMAWVVYSRCGLALLRRAWFNVDLIWAAALVITGLVTIMM